MPQERETYAPLTVHRAFVVHFRTNSDVTHGRMAGRVEHVTSGQVTYFASLEELLAFMGRVLATVRAPPQRQLRHHAGPGLAAADGHPPHPEYPSAHGCFSAATLATLRRFLGTDRFEFTIDSAVPDSCTQCTPTPASRK